MILKDEAEAAAKRPISFRSFVFRKQINHSYRRVARVEKWET